MSGKRSETLRLIWLEAFLWACFFGSVSEAAGAMKCNQSSVSRYIMSLEEWLQKALFSSLAPMRLTNDGLAFMKAAMGIVEISYAHRRSKKEDIPSVIALRPFLTKYYGWDAEHGREAVSSSHQGVIDAALPPGTA